MDGAGFSSTDAWAPPSARLASGRDIAHWSIAFYGQPRNAFERLWFKPGFRHCIAFAWIDTDRWLHVNPTLHRQMMKILTGPQHVRKLAALKRLGAARVDLYVNAGVRRVPRIATCAGTLAHVLGIRGALRPEGLYRALRRDFDRAEGPCKAS